MASVLILLLEFQKTQYVAYLYSVYAFLRSLDRLDNSLCLVDPTIGGIIKIPYIYL